MLFGWFVLALPFSLLLAFKPFLYKGGGGGNKEDAISFRILE